MASFITYHLQEKLKTFNYLRNNMYFTKLIGDRMPVNIQMQFYLSKIRMAFIYGIKIINLKKTNYTKIDSLQHRFLTTIIGTGPTTSDKNLRIVLGVPLLSDFIVKLKLMMYYDIFITNKNKFTRLIKSNYIEAYAAWKKNGYKIHGMPNQWIYPTIDFIRTLNRWNLSVKQYANINNLPTNRNDWKKIVDTHYKGIYQKELKSFLENNGSIFTIIFKDNLYKKYKNRTYCGMFDELNRLYKKSFATTDVRKSIKIILNSTKLNRITFEKNKIVPITKLTKQKKCILCKKTRNK
eukprot:203610_1